MMGRTFPATSGGNPHPELSIGFMCLIITITIAVISVLCGSRNRRRKSPNTAEETEKSSDASSPSPHQNSSPPSTPPNPPQSKSPINTNDAEDHRISVTEIPDVLPPPPSRHLSGEVGSQSMRPKRPKSIGREAGLLSSIIMRVPRNLSVSMRWSSSSKDLTTMGQKIKAKLEKEDSIWMKTIILGEKCRVEDEDDPVIYDDGGLEVTAYHPMVPSSLPVSRTNSYINPDAIPGRTSAVERTESGLMRGKEAVHLNQE